MKEQMQTPLSSWIKRFIFLAWAGSIVFVGFVYYMWTNDPFNDWWFNSKIWKAQHNTTILRNPRGKMAYDLKHRVLKPNMTRKQVVQILGPPDGGQGATSLTYKLGYWSPVFLIDEDIFIVEFDKSGHVAKSYWHQT